jgi:4-aminobutyrate aminotransferase-like enzyme/Ser/Thr protein kinase RdoA (MazF antagonist)
VARGRRSITSTTTPDLPVRGSASAALPQLTPSQAADVLERHWALTGTLTELGSFEDQNFAVVPDGEHEALYVLKINGPERSVSLELEHEVLHGLARAGLIYDLPLPVTTTSDTEIVEHGPDRVRLLRWVPGIPLADLEQSPGRLHELGALAGRIGIAMAAVTPSAPSADCKWDPRLAVRTVDDVLSDDDGPDESQQAVLEAAIAPLRDLDAASLPSQLIHCDITDVNTLVTGGGLTGLIDFGDVTDTWRVCDLAVACHAVIAGHTDDALQAILDVVAGYHDAARLSEREANALWPLILGRAAACAALDVRQVRLTPDSNYVREASDNDWLALTTLLALPAGLPTAAIRTRCGLPALPGDAWPQIFDDADPFPVVADLHARPIDLSVASDELHDGAWEDPRRVADAVSAARATIGRWGEVRLSAAVEPGPVPPSSLHLGADVFAAAGTHVRAPLEGTVTAVAEGEITLLLAGAHPPRYVRLAGIEPIVDVGTLIPAGTIVGHVAERTDRGPTRVHVQVATAPGQPGLGDPRRRIEWLAICPDPSALIGAPVAAPAPPDVRRELERREAVVAGAQELYYAEPMEMVRGWRQYLYDTDGRPYLDMVNNVASVGHSHPRVAAAAARQLRLLNTNSRFLYGPMIAYAERLSSLLPDSLDRVLFVNSGSEACDLALQLARVYTGRHDVVALAGAYHGWTTADYELCTAPGDSPGWRETKPDEVHVAEQPDPYRGRFGDDAAAYARSVDEACTAAARGGGVAAFISEPMLGNQGAVEPPAGYLRQAYAAVRKAGGVCIADEIQVGLARTGETFWAFEHEEVVPDIVTVAKAAGNGHPVGAVICRREIADALERRASFFSSPGGGPVSCEIGLAVLDTIAADGLQENAAAVGGQLKSGLEALAERHGAIGAVHGRGLYLGVDLVADRQSKAPARTLARAVCERMRRLGVVVQPTGDAGNVLKVKPPLCLTAEDAAMFTAALDRALTDVPPKVDFLEP